MTKTIGFKFNPARFFVFVTACIILWIVGDYLFTNFVLKTPFIFSPSRDILLPIICGAPFAALTQLLKMD